MATDSIVTVETVGATFRVRFNYHWRTVIKVKTIPDYRWVKGGKYWVFPASPWHAWRLYQVFPDLIGDNVVRHLALSMTYFRKATQVTTHPNPEGGLYPFQMAAVEYLNAVNGRALIADSTGLGKTVVALHWAKIRGIENMLVVCPLSVALKWIDEIRTWFDPHADISLIQDSMDSDIVVSTYDRMRRNVDYLTERGFDLVIFDESHAIKNYKSLRTKAAKKIAAHSKHILGLTATPMPNGPQDLFNQLNALRPWEYTSYWQYGKRYLENNHHSVELRDRLTSIMIRRKKAQVLSQLPGMTRSTMWVKLPPENEHFYFEIERATVQALQAMNPHHKGYYASVLDEITALRVAVGMAKAPLAANFANDFVDGKEGKLVIACHFRRTIQGIVDNLDHPYLTLTGQDNQEKRGGIIRQFREDPNIPILIMSSVGSEGIDLFGLDGNDISNILLVDRQWTAASEEQAEGRLHRLGQQFPVTAHYLLARGTIDIHMTHIVEAKRKAGEQVARQGEVVKEIVRRLLEGEEVTYHDTSDTV